MFSVVDRLLKFGKENEQEKDDWEKGLLFFEVGLREEESEKTDLSAFSC